MTGRRFVYACCVLLSLLFATAMSAQSRGAAADPISGTWAGELIPQGAPRPIQITMTLTFDRKSAVSGTVSGLPNPGDVKTGHFDPKTGGLKLQLGKTGESAVLLALDGTVAKGTATGRISGELAGEFKIAMKE
jgi:hypothetical protein